MLTHSSSPPAVFRRGKLDAFAHLMGTIPDADVARLAGSSVAGVKAHRARHGIQRWVGETAGRRPTELPVTGGRRSVGPVVLQSRPVASARPGRAFAADATGPSGSARVVVTGPDIVSAARVAEAVLAVRPGGPWALRAVCDLGDAG